MNKEIFCINCKFYKSDPNFRYPPGKNTGLDIHTTCNCQYNIDTHYSPKDPRKYISTPSIINRSRDCSWYEKNKKVETYVWDHDTSFPKKYKDHGEGTYNINPKDGIDGLYIGNKNLREIISETESHDIEDLKERVGKIEVEILELKNLEEKVNNLEEKVKRNSVNIVKLNKKINIVDKKTKVNSNKIEIINENISTINNKVDYLDTELDDIIKGRYIINGGNSFHFNI